jgi:hypothetical protein
MAITITLLLIVTAGVLAVLALLNSARALTFAAVGLLLLSIALIIQHGAILGR